MDFAENKTEIDNLQKIGEMVIKETISFEQMYLYDFKEHDDCKSFTHKSRLFEILENGKYVIGGFAPSTQKFHLFIYDPIKKLKTHELMFNEKIYEIFTFRNKIFFYLSGHGIKIMDENLNLIRETNAFPKSADESNLYCVFRGQIKFFDWNLKKLKRSIVFQYEDPKKGFYLKPARIDQFVKRDNKYFLNYQTQLAIFNESGVLLKEHKNINGNFLIDSNNNIIVNDAKNDLIYYYDCNGDLLKTVTYKRPKNFRTSIKQIKIDSFDNIQ